MTILDPYAHRITIGGRTYIMDVRAVDELGQHFDVEMQQTDPGNYGQRMMALITLYIVLWRKLVV
jgi:hypothetical protein